VCECVLFWVPQTEAGGTGTGTEAGAAAAAADTEENGWQSKEIVLWQM